MLYEKARGIIVPLQEQSPATSYIYVPTDIAKMNIKLHRSG
jgi:hypothetical protein